MWIRKRLDISAKDLVYSVFSCFSLGSENLISGKIKNFWEKNNQKCLICLSVRSGFDLLLEKLAFEPGSEILMSALTIPDMPRIVAHHSLIPVPLDLSTGKLIPTATMVENAITKKTKAIVIAHLFGGISDLEEIAQIARNHGLLLIEDCAQAYYSPDYTGDSAADVSMFSFGTIKTATALGGGILVFRNPELPFESILKSHESYPFQKRRKFLKKTLKYMVLHFISKPAVFPLFIQLLKKRGIDYDTYIHKLSRSFPKGNFFAEIRKRPGMPILKLMLRRFERYDFSVITQRTERGELLEKSLPASVIFPGRNANLKTYWAFPVLCTQPDKLVSELWKAGFDATHQSSLKIVESATNSAGKCPETAAKILNQIVYLPLYPEMPLTEFSKMATCMHDLISTPMPETVI